MRSLVAVVTGATAGLGLGLGRAVAKRLAEDGFSVIVVGRNAECGAEVIQEITEAGRRARFIAANLTTFSAWPLTLVNSTFW